MYFFAQPSAFPASPTPGDGKHRNLFSLLMMDLPFLATENRWKN